MYDFLLFIITILCIVLVWHLSVDLSMLCAVLLKPNAKFTYNSLNISFCASKVSYLNVETFFPYHSHDTIWLHTLSKCPYLSFKTFFKNRRFHDFSHHTSSSFIHVINFPSSEDNKDCYLKRFKLLNIFNNHKYFLLDLSILYWIAEEHLAELMPIFEQLRAQGDLPCTYPLHVSSSAFGTAYIRGGSRSTPLSPHAPHCHPSVHWVSFSTVFESTSVFQRRRDVMVITGVHDTIIVCVKSWFSLRLSICLMDNRNTFSAMASSQKKIHWKGHEP